MLDVRQGDTFVVTYPEIYRDGVYVRDGPILAAEFVNNGRDYRAVRYTDPDGGSHYYTPEGKSLHKAFLRAPVEFSRDQLALQLRPLPPDPEPDPRPPGHRLRRPRWAPRCAPPATAASRFAGRKGGYGNVVEIEHSGERRHGLRPPVALRRRHPASARA